MNIKQTEKVLEKFEKALHRGTTENCDKLYQEALWNNCAVQEMWDAMDFLRNWFDSLKNEYFRTKCLNNASKIKSPEEGCSNCRAPSREII